MSTVPASTVPVGTGVHPLDLARAWLPADDDPERPQVTLATTGPDGEPAARTVLLSEVVHDGFALHTDARSAKAADLRADPRACLVVLWPGFTRQLVVQGRVRAQPEPELVAAYARRSPYLKHLAWLNDAELARLPLPERRARWARAEQLHPDGPPTPPPTWAGFVLVPHRVVFWEAAPDTASRRTEHVRTATGWVTDHLPG